jgi:hypothetical protein
MTIIQASFSAALLLLLAVDRSTSIAEALTTTSSRVTRFGIVQKVTTKYTASTLFSIPSTSSSSPPPSTAEMINGAVNGAKVSFVEEVEKPRLSRLTRLRQVSNFASVLCVLDCTLLPIVTVALPLFSFLNLGAAQLEFMHQLGHGIALLFVLPVGSLTGIVNYMSHKNGLIASLSVVGLMLVGVANYHSHSLPLLGHVHWLHLIQHGLYHRVANTAGCALLLGSNYLSQKQPGCAHCPDSASQSSHSHDHSHGHHEH